MSKKIAVVGSLNMDLVVNTPRVPVLGETVLGNNFLTVPGGKGANQAVTIGRLGGNVHMAGCVGNDTFGAELLNNLNRNNVDIHNVRMLDGSATGIAMIIVKDGDNFIIVDPGANTCLTEEMIEALENEIKESFMMVIQLEIPLQTVEKAINIARKFNVKVLLNPAPAALLSDELLAKVDIITPNESECEIITGINIKSINEAKKAVAYLNNKGVPQVIVTLGGNGIVYNSGCNILHKAAPKVNAVDTTAAGDSFTGALAFALSEGKDIDNAVDFASIVAALTVTKKGAQSSIPFMHEVQEFINK